jgi:hypothetical protein
MNKKNLILSIVFVVLVVSAFVYSGPYKNWQENLNKKESFFSEVNLDQVTKYVITHQGEETILEKQGEALKVAGAKDFYVEETVKDAFLQVLADAKAVNMEVVSKNKEKRGDFGFSDNEVMKLALLENDNLLVEILVGKMTNNYQGSYISKVDSDKVYAIDVNLNAVLNRDEWRDHNILSMNKEVINQIRFQYPSREFTVAKDVETGEWAGTLPYAFKVDPDKMNEIVSLLSNLQAVSIPEQNFENTGLDKHLIIIQASGEGQDNTLMIGEANEAGNYYAKRGNSDNIYLITEAERNLLDKQIWELK